ncbi:MAG: hypothetical protein KJ949_00440 [Nanoarchaeota archaeon]|nr:hypothetical protein [Nanoarchaeota archaeon]MBU4308515.1 hypothetical protein [Nanoarchaeota archaeon]
MVKTQKLNAIKFGIAGGFITVICIFLTGMAMLIGPRYTPSLANFFNQIYGIFGLQTNLFAVILISILSFIDGFILTLVFALIYNKL